MLLNVLADGLCGLVADVFQDSVALGRSVALGLHLRHAVGPTLLLEVNDAVGIGDLYTFILLYKSALFLCSGLANFVPDGLAVVDDLVHALVMVLSPTDFVGDLVYDMSALQLVILLVVFVLIEEFGISNHQKQAERKKTKDLRHDAAKSAQKS